MGINTRIRVQRLRTDENDRVKEVTYNHIQEQSEGNFLK